MNPTPFEVLIVACAKAQANNKEQEFIDAFLEELGLSYQELISAARHASKDWKLETAHS